MSLRQFIIEKELEDKIQLDVREVTSQEVKLCKDIQRISRIVHDALGKKDKMEIADISDLASALHRYDSEFRFLKPIVVELRKFVELHGKQQSSMDILKANIDKIRQHSKELSLAFLAHDLKGGEKHNTALNDIIKQVDTNIDAPIHAGRLVRRHFKAETSFFGTTNLLDWLGDDQYLQIKSLDLSKTLYTALDFPLSKMEDDWHYLVYFMLNLQETADPKAFDSRDFRTHSKVAHISSPEFKELHKLVDSYIHDNDKKKIPHIVALIEKLPAIKAANNVCKRKIKVVYRGIPESEDGSSIDGIIAQDRKTKYVATSEHRSAAKNFALQKGHLESEDARRSEVGYIIKYDVTPEAILFDTKIIETAYNESEVLIDVTKATVDDVEEV